MHSGLAATHSLLFLPNVAAITLLLTTAKKKKKEEENIGQAQKFEAIKNVPFFLIMLASEFSR